jgi:hypothetical protein
MAARQADKKKSGRDARGQMAIPTHPLMDEDRCLAAWLRAACLRPHSFISTLHHYWLLAYHIVKILRLLMVLDRLPNGKGKK